MNATFQASLSCCLCTSQLRRPPDIAFRSRADRRHRVWCYTDFCYYNCDFRFCFALFNREHTRVWSKQSMLLITHSSLRTTESTRETGNMCKSGVTDFNVFCGYPQFTRRGPPPPVAFTVILVKDAPTHLLSMSTWMLLDLCGGGGTPPRFKIVVPTGLLLRPPTGGSA